MQSRLCLDGIARLWFLCFWWRCLFLGRRLVFDAEEKFETEVCWSRLHHREGIGFNLASLVRKVA